MPRRSANFRSQEFRVPGGPKREALTAAARVYNTGDPGVQNLRRSGRRANANSWQSEIWDLYDVVPEFHSACTWVGNLLSKVKLYVAKDGKPTNNKVALDALASLFNGPEGQEEMLRLLGVNFTAAGEAWVVGIPGKEEDIWRVVASKEISGQSTLDLKIEGEAAPPGTIGIRLWRMHPANSEESDPPARALLPVLTQLHRLTQVVNAQADSRLKGNGILWTPLEMEIPALPVSQENGDDETAALQPVTGATGLTARMIQVAKIAMADRDSAAAAIPIVVGIPNEFGKPEWTDFFTGFDEQVKGLREEAITRIGIGMDMPPEALTGTAGVNHWGMWAVDEAGIKIHTEPLVGVIVSSLAKGYLHPLLKAEGVPDWEAYSFEADTTALRSRPNRSKEAIELFNLGELSARSLLIETGFDPDNDAPDDKERMFQFVRRMVDRSNAAPEQISELLRIVGVSGVPTTSDPARGALEPPNKRDAPERGAPDPEDSEAGVVRASAAFVVDGLVLASEAYVLRALERAGNKIKNKIGRESSHAAVELYLTAPRMPLRECEQMLDDGWALLDRAEAIPGVRMERLKSVLNDYALALLRQQRPYSRGDLARALLIELADEAA